MRKYLRAANVTWNGLSLDDVKEMNFEPEEFERYRLEPGDLLLGEGSGSPEEVGKPAIWRSELPKCAFQNTLVRVRPLGEINRTYLMYLFWYEARSGNFGAASRGVNIHHIGARTLSEWPIPVPPVHEQHRIVMAIEEHFSRLDAGLESLGRVIRSVNHHRAAILKTAVEGRLVPQDAADEQAELLLRRVRETRPRMPRVEDPLPWRGRDLPGSWQFATLAEVARDDGVFSDGDWIESKDPGPQR